MQTDRKILLTTSRNPTPNIRTLCNDLARMLPNTVRVNRGKMSVDETAEKALENDADRVVIIDRWQGGPGEIKFFQIGESGPVFVPPTIHVVRIKLQREFCDVPRSRPASSIAVSEDESIGEAPKLAKALSRFCNIPILLIGGQEGETNSTEMRVYADNTGKIAITFVANPVHAEVGPKIVVSCVDWKAI